MFEDHFSAAADAYARHRPHYPVALYDWLTEQTDRRRLAWDCATGNGQAAAGLARRFRRVVASDASPAQLAHAVRSPRIWYLTAVAERVPLPDGCLDLATCAQAAHWFEHDAFHAELRRLLRPGGLVALWGYHVARIEPRVDKILWRLYRGFTRPWWSPRVRHLDDRYDSLPFPFEEIVPIPRFTMSAELDLPALHGLLGTWSGLRTFVAERGREELEPHLARLADAWGDPVRRRTARWEIFLRVGRV